MTDKGKDKGKELFCEVMQVINGKITRDIKSALVNALVATISLRASNEDEAIIQWNELSLHADKLIHHRFKMILSEVDQFDSTKIRFNGD